MGVCALLLDRFADGGWELIRPEPRPSTTGKLDERDCDLVESAAPAPGVTADEERLAAAADARLLPVIRPLADKLVENGEQRRGQRAPRGSGGARRRSICSP